MKNYNLHFYDLVASYRNPATANEPQLEKIGKQLQHYAREVNGEVFLFNLHTGDYTAINDPAYPRASQLPAFYNSRMLSQLIHSEDLGGVIRSKLNALEKLQTIPVDEAHHFRLALECRMRNPGGGYTRYIHTYRVVSLDDQGYPWLLQLVLTPVFGIEIDEPLLNQMIIDIRLKKIIYPLRPQPITPCELAVLRLSIRGLTSQEIARQLFKSSETIEKHRKNILYKNRLKDTAQATHYYRTLNLL